MPEFVAGNLILIVQEASLNALRHGRARHIDVRVVDHPEVRVIEVEVRDFDQAARPGVEQGHFGIQGMRERAERLGGALVIESEPGQGTVVRLTVRRHEMDCELTKAGPKP
jgi:signal transduction histidine kinase